MERIFSALIKLALAGVFAFSLYRDATQSITTEEAIVFERLVHPSLRDVIAGREVGTQLLRTILTKRTVGLARLSEFSFRLPDLFGEALFLWAIHRLTRRYCVLFAVASLIPGDHLALGLVAAAVAIDSGVCAGLAIAANPWSAVPIVLWWVRRFSLPKIESTILITILTAFIFLAIPVISGNPDALRTWPIAAADNRSREAIQALRSDAGSRHIRIGGSPELYPVVNFYRARYRLSNWENLYPEAKAPFDYYVLTPASSDPRLLTIYRNSMMIIGK